MSSGLRRELTEPVTPREPATAAGILDSAGIGAGGSSVDAAMTGLRGLPALLAEAEADDLLRAAVREEAIARLKEARIGSPAKMVDAALSSCKANDNGDSDRKGRPLLLADTEPWDESVDGNALLNELSHEVCRYVALPEGAATAIALWVVFAHSHDQANVSPLLTITSPTKRCGKTTLMTLLSNLVSRPLPASNITAAALFRAVDRYHPTLLVDEADTFINEHEELRGILNSGHTRGLAYVIRCDGEDREPRMFSTWCPKAVAVIGSLPDTLADRSVSIPMRRKTRGESTDRLRLYQLDLKDLRRKVARWVTDHPELAATDPNVPDTLSDRAADNWRPLLAIADCAGGDWPEMARRAATTLSGTSEKDNAPSITLLEDLKRLFDESGCDQLESAQIVDALVAMEEHPWPEWRNGKPLTAASLSRLLSPFKIRPKQYWDDGKVRGYYRKDFGDVWSRYLTLDGSAPVAPSEETQAESGRTGRTVTGSAFGPISRVVGDERPTTCENDENPRPDCKLPALPLATEVRHSG